MGELELAEGQGAASKSKFVACKMRRAAVCHVVCSCVCLSIRVCVCVSLCVYARV